MKLTKETLRQIIKEELEAIVKEEELDEGLFDFLRGDKGTVAAQEPGLWKMAGEDASIQEIGLQLVKNVREFLNRYKGKEEAGNWIINSLKKNDISFCEALWMVENGLAYGGTEMAKQALAKMSAGSSMGRACGSSSQATVAGRKEMPYTIQELFDAGLKAEKGRKGEG